MTDSETCKTHPNLWVVIVGLLILHQDVWFWDSQTVVVGLPIGMAYHVVFSIVVALAFSLVLKYAWPAEVEASGEKDTAHAPSENHPSQ